MSLEDIMSYARGIPTHRELEEEPVVSLYSRVKTLLMRDGQVEVEKDLIPAWVTSLFIRGKHRVRLSIEKRVLLPDETNRYYPATVRLNTEFKTLPQEQKSKIKDQDDLYIEIFPEADQNNEFRNISILLGGDSGHYWSGISYSMDHLGNYDALNSDGCKMINQLLDLVERT